MLARLRVTSSFGGDASDHDCSSGCRVSCRKTSSREACRGHNSETSSPACTRARLTRGRGLGVGGDLQRAVDGGDRLHLEERRHQLGSPVQRLGAHQQAAVASTQLLHGALADEGAVAEDADAVADLLDLRHLVAGQQHGAALLAEGG